MPSLPTAAGLNEILVRCEERSAYPSGRSFFVVESERFVMDKHLHYIADDFQRRAMIQTAVRKAIELARDSFFHGLMIDAMDDDDLALFAGEAWKAYTLRIEFDYPSYAETLFLGGYRMAYRVYQRDLPHGIHPSAVILADQFEAEIGLVRWPLSGSGA